MEIYDFARIREAWIVGGTARCRGGVGHFIDAYSHRFANVALVRH